MARESMDLVVIKMKVRKTAKRAVMKSSRRGGRRKESGIRAKVRAEDSGM